MCKWKEQILSLMYSDTYLRFLMMTSSNGNIFRATGPLCWNSPLTGEFPSQRPVTRSFDFSLICAWINSWVKYREAGDLRRHRDQYDVNVMRLRYMSGDDTPRQQQMMNKVNRPSVATVATVDCNILWTMCISPNCISRATWCSIKPVQSLLSG